jgi:hypothetical protein
MENKISDFPQKEIDVLMMYNFNLKMLEDGGRSTLKINNFIYLLL